MNNDPLINLGRIAAFFTRTNIGGNTLGSSLSDFDDIMSRYQSSPMSVAKMRQILTGNFEQSYRSFERSYFDTLSDSKNLRKGVKVDVELLKAQKRIDLSLLNYTEQQRLQKHYLQGVLQQDQLFSQVGLPGMVMPNANPTRMSMKYMIDSSNIEDPAQILFNRLSFSIDPFTGNISIPKSNLPTFDALTSAIEQKQAFDADFFRGKRVGIFDVETTGVYRGAQIRSMAIAEVANNTTRVVEDIAFNSDQLRGFSIRNMVNGVEEYINFNTLLKQEEGIQNLRSMGSGGQDFLDEAVRYIDTLLSFDAISAHNAKFDIDMLTSSMTAMPAFAKHEHAQMARAKLYSRINDTTRDPFLIDTLDIARSYLQDQATVLAQRSAAANPGLNLGEEIINNLFDPKILKRAQIGGSASYASVEAIAMRTNLMELILSNTPTFFDDLGGSAHMASFDTALQGEMARFMSSKQLKLVGMDDFGIFDSDIIAQSDQMRQRIFRSSALVPNLNIQDINRVSDATYQYLLRNTEGVIIDELGAGESISDILTSARTTGTITGSLDAQNRILSLGINFFEETASNEMSRLLSERGNISRQITDQTILDAYTITERNFGSKISNIILPRKDPNFPFSQGLAQEVDFNDTLSVSRAFSTIGSPFDFLDTRSRIISASIAQITADNAQSIYTSMIDAGVDENVLKNIAFTSYAKEMSSEGISYFSSSRVNDAIKVFDTASNFSKVQLPFEIAKEAYERSQIIGSMEDAFSSLSLSVDSTDRVNLTWNVGKQASKDEIDNLTMSIFDIIDSGPGDTKARELLRGLQIDNEVNAVAAMRQLNTQGQHRTTIMQSEAFQKVSEMIRERGIAIVRLGEEQSEKLITTISAHRIPMGALEADTIISHWTARLLSDHNGHLIVGPFINDTASRINNVKYEGRRALEYLNEIATHISESSGLGEEILSERRMAMYSDDAASWTRAYQAAKPQMKIGALALSAAVVGYYASNRMEERSLLNETVEAQPREIPGARASLRSPQSYRMDPLLTSGIVGGLDANKSSHFRMGPDKYNHLFGQ
jgi:hypothetical protein